MGARETSSEIGDAAADWATRFDEGRLSEEEQTEFNRWIEADSRRVGAFVRAQAVLAHVRRAKALGSDFEPSSFVAEPAEPAAAEEIVSRQPNVTRRRMLIGASAIAATGLFAFVVPMGRAAANIYETRRGEIRLVPLEDGSTVTLNTDSRIAVSISGSKRKAEVMRGEVLFKVAALDDAPFFVNAGDASVQAQGAMFTVCRLADQPLQVKVCEGSVDISRSTLMARQSHRLGANMGAIVGADGHIVDQLLSPSELRRELSWREGMLSFEDTPLKDAVEEFARYSDRHIRIADPSVAAETVTGLYAANNPEGFAQAVALGLDLRMQTASNDILLMR